MGYVSEDGVWLDGSQITLQSLVERFCCSTPPDLRVRIRTCEHPERKLLFMSAELVGERRFFVVSGNDLDSMTKEVVQMWETFEASKA